VIDTYALLSRTRDDSDEDTIPGNVVQEDGRRSVYRIVGLCTGDESILPVEPQGSPIIEIDAHPGRKKEVVSVGSG